MKIAMVSEHASPLAAIAGEDAGGQNVHVAALAVHVARAGHDVTVWTRRDDPQLAPSVVRGGVTIEHVEAGPPEPVAKDELPRWMDDFGLVLAHRWRSDPPDVIHAHFWMSGDAALRARPPNCPVVQTFHALGVVKRRHQGRADPSPPERIDVERRITRDVDRVVATCRDEVAELVAMGADPARIDVVPCGVELTRFAPTGPTEPCPARHRVVVLGRLVPRKGVDDVIRAVAMLDADVELTVAGGPPPEQMDRDAEVCRLRDLATRLGVADRVRLRGAVTRDEVPALLRSADVVACAPWYEPFGIVPLEAMACGVPVVATAVGGMLDSVAHERTGVHVPVRDPASLAAALRRLLDDRALRERMGRSGRHRVEQDFGWPHVAARTLHTYRRCAITPRPADRALAVRQGVGS